MERLILLLLFCLTSHSAKLTATCVTNFKQEVTEKKVIKLNTQGSIRKSPKTSIFIYLEGHILQCGKDFSVCTITLISEDEIIFSDVTDMNGDLVLPDNIEGEFKIVLNSGGNIDYIGIVQL